jgi:hypothetical protein
MGDGNGVRFWGVAEMERSATHNDQYHIYDSYFGRNGNDKSIKHY